MERLDIREPCERARDNGLRSRTICVERGRDARRRDVRTLRRDTDSGSRKSDAATSRSVRQAQGMC